MATDFSFKFSKGDFTSQKEFDRRMDRALFGVCRYWDGKIESYAKHNASWTDRTTNARNGLRAEAAKFEGVGLYGIVLAHSVTYGVYLEAPDSETKRPIIMPTLTIFAPKVMRFLNKLMDRM